MTATRFHAAARGSSPNLPVLYVDPEAAQRRKQPPYTPKHALEPERKDRTVFWLFVVLIVTSGFVVGTTAAFQASTTDGVNNIVGSASLSKPVDQTLSVEGTNLALTINGFGNFEDVPGVSYGSRWRYRWPTGIGGTGSTPTCSSLASDYPDDLTDSSTNTGSINYETITGWGNGRWLCVMAHTAFPAAKPAAPALQWWSADGTARATQLGHVVQRVTLQNGAPSSGGSLGQGDQIVVGFSQAVEASDRPTSGLVCARTATNAIFIAPVNSSNGNAIGNCNPAGNNPSVDMFYLEGLTAGAVGSSQQYATASPWTWSDDGKQVTITLSSGASQTITCGTPCFRVRMANTWGAATRLESATGARPLCTTLHGNTNFDNGSCEPYAVGNF